MEEFFIQTVGFRFFLFLWMSIVFAAIGLYFLARLMYVQKMAGKFAIFLVCGIVAAAYFILLISGAATAISCNPVYHGMWTALFVVNFVYAMLCQILFKFLDMIKEKLSFIAGKAQFWKKDETQPLASKEGTEQPKNYDSINQA